MFKALTEKNAYPFGFCHMCGIIGFTGRQNAVPILLQGLHALEYRGYDSAGISVLNSDNITTIKTKGRVSEVEKAISAQNEPLTSFCGIGHTRWATHGEPSYVNAHPHCTNNIAIVHNGIIENYAEIKSRLFSKGYTFDSQTDTEIALKLIDQKYLQTSEPLSAIKLALSELCGSYAFGIIFKNIPNKIFAVKKDSPLIIAKSPNGNFIASDVTAILKYTNICTTLSDGETAVLSENDIEFYDSLGNKIAKTFEKIDWNYEEATKSGFPHFMLKEINEEPEAIKNTVRSIIKNNTPNFDITNLTDDDIYNCQTIHIVACGTAMHAGLIGKFYIEKYAGISVNVELASEFRYRNPILNKNDIFIALSQSGETADTLAALRLAKSRGLKTLSVINVRGSTLARESDSVIYTNAGPEIAVASTKAYIVQVSVMYMIATKFALILKKLTFAKAEKNMALLYSEVPKAIATVISKSEIIRNSALRLKNVNNLFFIGRGLDWSLSREASLKLKEISYIHSEAHAAGELKHGTFSLITPQTEIIAIITDNDISSKTISNIKEVKSRGANVTLLCDETVTVPLETYDNVIYVPHLQNDLTCLCAACAFQLLAYHTADFRECDIDKPRNLAKSVTVE